MSSMTEYKLLTELQNIHWESDHHCSIRNALALQPMGEAECHSDKECIGNCAWTTLPEACSCLTADEWENGNGGLQEKRGLQDLILSMLGGRRTVEPDGRQSIRMKDNGVGIMDFRVGRRTDEWHEGLSVEPTERPTECEMTENDRIVSHHWGEFSPICICSGLVRWNPTLIFWASLLMVRVVTNIHLFHLSSRHTTSDDGVCLTIPWFYTHHLAIIPPHGSVTMWSHRHDGGV